MAHAADAHHRAATGAGCRLEACACACATLARIPRNPDEPNYNPRGRTYGNWRGAICPIAIDVQLAELVRNILSERRHPQV